MTTRKTRRAKMGGYGSGGGNKKHKSIKLTYDHGVPPWERSREETDPAWEAFKVYRNMDTRRTFVSLSGQLNKSTVLLSGWGTKFNWRERVLAYDRHMDKIKLEAKAKAQIDAIMEMEKRHVKQAMLMQGLGSMALSKYLRKEKRDPENPKLKPGRAQSLVAEGTRLERTTRGKPETIQEQRITGDDFEDIRKLFQDPDTREALEKISRKLGK